MSFSDIHSLVSDIQIKLLLEQEFFRHEELKLCKTQAEKDKLLDRWAIQDSAEKIASAIRVASYNQRRGFLGFF